jgi:Tol biopolymer transport system component
VGSGLYVVPALGGPERKLRATHIIHPETAPISWSPDGKWLAFVDVPPDSQQEKLNLLSLDTLKSNQIPEAAHCIHEGLPAFTHDGKQLAYTCAASALEGYIYSLAIETGTAKLIGKFSGAWASGNVWTGDDSHLIFAQDLGGGGELWELTLADGSLRELPFGQGLAWPTISRKGDKLAFAYLYDNINIWRKDLTHNESHAVELIVSTREQTNPSYSPDGKHIAFESTRAGSREIWISDANGTSLLQVSRFKRSITGTPHWSPDARKIVFDSWNTMNPEVYVVDITEMIPHKLLTNISGIYHPSWSHDGKWIYFLSDPQAPRLYRCPAEGGDAVMLSSELAYGFYESFDEEAIFFVDGWTDTNLKKVSGNHGGAASSVLGMPPLKDASLWTVVRRGIYFVPADAPRSIRYFDLSTRQVRHITDVDRDFNSTNGGLSVSPDGRWLLYSQVDQKNSDILFVNNFH